MASSGHFLDCVSTECLLRTLTMEEIKAVVGPSSFTRQGKRRRDDMIREVVGLGTTQQTRLYQAVVTKRREVVEGRETKRRKVTNDTEWDNEYMDSPADDVVQDSLCQFIDRTSNKNLVFTLCMVCGRIHDAADGESMDITHIPNKQQLKPHIAHRGHLLVEGLLLHDPAIKEKDGKPMGKVCNECLRDLLKNRLPLYSLANDMWIGRIPHELAVLTLPEQVLIARYFPASYIVKLYPKNKAAWKWDRESLNSGIKGNVSTYRLDSTQIASMIEGNLMPQPAMLIAATLGITIVGPRNLPERCMPGFLRVRRGRVKAALSWLKTNNPFYANIVISSERLNMLPVDAVPDELLVVAKYSNNCQLLEQEREGYVPSDENEEAENHEQVIDRPAAGKKRLLSENDRN